MGMKTKTVGGSGTGLGGDFAQWLQQGLMGGNFGGGGASAGGMSGILNSILGGGAGTLGGALSQQLQTQQTNDINSIRSRYSVGGGTGFGTPAAYGESTYRAQAAPQITSAIGNLQLSALMPLLGMTGQMAGRDIPQASTMAEQNPIMQGLGLAIPMLSGLAGGGAFSNMFGGGSAAGGAGGMSPMSLDFSGFSPGNMNPFQSNPNVGFGAGPMPGFPGLIQ